MREKNLKIPTCHKGAANQWKVRRWRKKQTYKQTNHLHFMTRSHHAKTQPIWIAANHFTASQFWNATLLHNVARAATRLQYGRAAITARTCTITACCTYSFMFNSTRFFLVFRKEIRLYSREDAEETDYLLKHNWIRDFWEHLAGMLLSWLTRLGHK